MPTDAGVGPDRTDLGAGRADDRGVVVLVVAYGAPELFERCLAPLHGAFPVLVVDNSSDASIKAISERNGARYLDPGANLGFGAGVNRGLADLQGQGGDVLLLNPDAQIEAEGVHSLRRCLHARADLACVAPIQTDPEGASSARVVWPFPTPWGAWVEALGLGRLRNHGDFLIGSVLLMRSTALEEVGGFDERFFLYAEETDWQRRAHDLGWRVALCSEVEATHVGAGTGGDPGAREVHFHASHERYIRKHYGRAGWQAYRTGQAAGAFVRALILPGARGRRAANRFHLYWRGPVRVESDQRAS
jgi:GT2 family glycosyltransferase